jgi:hypothetical protein
MTARPLELSFCAFEAAPPAAAAAAAQGGGGPTGVGSAPTSLLGRFGRLLGGGGDGGGGPPRSPPSNGTGAPPWPLSAATTAASDGGGGGGPVQVYGQAIDLAVPTVISHTYYQLSVAVGAGTTRWCGGRCVLLGGRFD